MNTTTAPRPLPADRTHADPRGVHRVRRFFGVVARPQSYRNIAYLLLGLPLGIALVHGAS